MSDRPACSLVVTRVVRKGKEDAFRRWSDQLGEHARGAPGHCEELLLEQSGGIYHLMQRFSSRGDLEAWRADGTYARLMEEGDRFSTSREQTLDSKQTSVRLPSEADGPKWKRFVMTWLAVLPIILAVNAALDALPVQLPGPARSAASSLVMVATMTWFILPFVSRRVKPWVLRNSEGNAPIG